MAKKLVRHGNSYAFVVDKPIMDALGITPDTLLEIATDGRRLFVFPATDIKARQRIERALTAGTKAVDQALKISRRPKQ